jgi:hypothetical protein
VTGEETSDDNGLGKNREPDGLGKPESSEGVDGAVAASVAGVTPLGLESIDNKVFGGSKIRSFGGVGVDVSFDSTAELGCSNAD